MRDYAFYNGVFTPYDACAIPLSDRSIFFADAVYDVVIGRRGNAYQLDEHLERLFCNAKIVGFKNMPQKSYIEDAVSDIIKLSEADCFVLYIQLSANEMRRKHLRCEDKTNLLITISSAEIPCKLEGASAITMKDNRYAYCNVKTTNLLPAVLSMNEAHKASADLAIFHKNRIITECSASNISILSGNQLITHPLDSSILPGISEKNLIEVCKDLGIVHIEREFNLSELLRADAVLVTSTTKFVKICEKIDDVRLISEKTYLANEIFDIMLNDFLAKT